MKPKGCFNCIFSSRHLSYAIGKTFYRICEKSLAGKVAVLMKEENKSKPLCVWYKKITTDQIREHRQILSILRGADKRITS